MSSSENTPKKAAPRISLDTIITAISHKARWQIFRELIKGKPLPVVEIARRTGITPASVSKHMIFLHDCGIATRGLGGLYEMPERFFIPGEEAVDLGACVLRLDQLD